jgi:hypothetical protein
MSSRWTWIAAASLAFCAVDAALAGDKPAAPAAATKTSTAGMTAQEIELARYLEMLEEMELLENWDFLELLSVLEDEE